MMNWKTVESGFWVFVVIMVVGLIECNAFEVRKNKGHNHLPEIVSGFGQVPECWWAADVIADPSPLGFLSPAVSIVENTVSQVVTLVTNVAAPTYAHVYPYGVAMTVNISVPSCDAVTFDVSQPNAVVYGTVFFNGFTKMLNSGNVWVHSAPGCTVAVTHLTLNNHTPISNDIIVEGGAVSSIVNSVTYSNSALADCNFKLSAGIKITCNPLNEFAAPSRIRFTFAQPCHT